MRMKGERENAVLALDYLSISISPDRLRLGPLVWSGWEFGYRLLILIKAFLFFFFLNKLLVSALSHDIINLERTRNIPCTLFYVA